jgi:membrane-bound lytic murein transglycosylase B
MSLTRRLALSSALAALAPETLAATQSFEAFLEGIRQEARRGGVSPATLQRALSGIRPTTACWSWTGASRNSPRPGSSTATPACPSADRWRPPRLRRQPRHAGGRAGPLPRPPRVVVAIWGLETNYGGFTGNFNVVESLATLAWDGRRSAYFRAELLAALKILDGGHVAPDRMRGSWAGAMGHPQFMPSNFDRLAVDMDGDGRRDIWENRADALGSIANYLARSGWREEELWGREVVLPAGFNPEDARRRTPGRCANGRRWASAGRMAPRCRRSTSRPPS